MDLTTSYLGLTLHSPLVASASPVTARLDALRAVADSGVGAVVLPSLFEEQVRQQESSHSRIDGTQKSSDFANSLAREFWDSHTFKESSGTVMCRQFTTALKS